MTIAKSVGRAVCAGWFGHPPCYHDYFLSYFTKKTEKEKADCHYLLYKYKRSVS
ncbi:hypothetical protein MOE21_08060 [Bacillus atrophaeus]|uniref:hypothetical protein n=1 Tax=Bacillus atrophaeus TaxID=1452 RepID=UPI0022813D7C|nr:hypothetical protein [Bacillus atrophaeus]MCY8932615.1 hypothetical protein [Bacillus atrophaeus]